MPTNFTPDALFGATVTDNAGEKIGKVDEVYLDNSSGQPEWVSVKTGLFGSNVSLIPLAQATQSAETVTVPFDKATVKDAPHHDPGAELSETDEADLYRYYGIADTSGSATGGTNEVYRGANTDHVSGDVTTPRADATTDAGATTDATATTTDDLVDGDVAATAGRGAGHDTSGPNTDDAMTRSKEELHVGTEVREAGRARLRKHITTENVSRTVPVSHEEVVVEREPITDANVGDALRGGDLTEEEHEVVLTEEHAVASKETVPVERVRVGKQTVEGTETVEAEVREEKIDLDAGQETTAGTTGRNDRA